MVDPKYLAVLSKISSSLTATQVNWALTGSLSFALQGVPVVPNDIDLQTDEHGAYDIERLFAPFMIRKVTFSSTATIRSHFGAFVMDGITVEIMGNLQKRLTNGEWEAPVDVERYEQVIQVNGLNLPVLSLAYEYQAYIQLGRRERAQLLKEVLERGTI